MINDNYTHIQKLVKQKQINSKLELNSTKTNGIYTFSGNKLEDLINKPNELKNVVGFLSDLQYSLALKTNKIIPIHLRLDLNQTRQIYQNHYNKTNQPQFQKLQKITENTNPYFDLCFYTLTKYKSADYIGFPGFEFFEDKKFINHYIKEFKENLKLIQN